MQRFIIIFLWIIVFHSVALGYQWPMMDENANRDNVRVESNFCDYRPASSPPHFHEGIDIPQQENAQTQELYIWPIDYGKVERIESERNVWIRHWTYNENQRMFVNPKGEGSRYIHARVICGQGEEMRLDNPVAEGWGMERSHLHLEYRTPGSLANSKNPFVIWELNPSDSYDPVVCTLYVDHSEKGAAQVENWNFLSYDFADYYEQGTLYPPFKKLTLSNTLYYDLDDPHILISGNRKVRFVLDGYDEITETHQSHWSGCAPYFIMLFLNFDKPPAEISDADDSVAYYAVRFDTLKESGDEVHQEEDVYHTETPLISGLEYARQYYRLYPRDNSPPSCVISKDGVLATEILPDGSYQIRIFVRDYYGRRRTADVHFYIRSSVWVDYCRCFPE